MPAPPQNLPVTHWHDIYPGIDPTIHYKNQTYQNKVVLVTGASRGIGEEIATFYARAGASLALVARTTDALKLVQEKIVKEVPGARVEIFTADVCESKQVKDAVEGTAEKFGRLDIVVANAGRADPWTIPFIEMEADTWWKTVEINLRGVYNAAHFSVPHLKKTSGYFVIISAALAQYIRPFTSPYAVSKHACGRLNEFIALENPEVKSFSIHPGAIMTALVDSNPQLAHMVSETVQLPAATLLRLTSGREDWLSGKFVDARWDLDEVEKVWKAKILEIDGLVNRFSVPL
ncbi:NAD-P-binding protein [Sistotremastrum niveocremeum HHB9708]|uniref:NAD-P-binding protein n=1 Tax=Sistotremastrum niveocremeum HHB9708 TaxID=1314777 RepID=A0A164N726_9AGAM|nr:NAD-P-binding protein [Sistotremastrum niveocremeum HHB9708]